MTNTMTTTWARPGDMAAAGAENRPISLRFRHAFLGTVAAGALSLAAGGSALANDPCVLSAGNTIETCTGNQSGGVPNPVPTVATLNVNNLNQAITPPSGTKGITFSSAGAVTINSDTGTFGITTAGVSAYGIYAKSAGAGAVTVTSTGNMTTSGASSDGITAVSGSGAVTVTSTGNITATGTSSGGINTQSAGAVTVTSTGNITGPGVGIFATSTGGAAVAVTSSGNIATASAGAQGIFATSTGGGPVAVTSTGNVATAGFGASGIFASGDGAVTVTSAGNVSTTNAAGIGIYSKSNGGGVIGMTSTGNITTAGAGGIGMYAKSGGAVTMTSTGDISTLGDGAIAIYGSSTAGLVAVTSVGNINTVRNGAIGIFAQSTSGAVAAISTGNIATAGNGAIGIFAESTTGAVAVTSAGNIATAGNGAIGIFAESTTGAVAVTSIGNITTAGPGGIGIYGSSSGAAAVVLNSTGNITTVGAGTFGIYARNTGGVTTVTSAGNITTAGDNAYAISARSSSGAATVTSTGNIITTGNQSVGISAHGVSAVTVSSIGNIATSGGNGSIGIYAYGGIGTPVTVNSKGNITTAGTSGVGIAAVSGGVGALAVTSNGDITTAGAGASGIGAQSTGTGAITITSTGNIATTGIKAYGISANSTGSSAVTVTSTGNITTAAGNGSGAIGAGSVGGAVTVTSAGNLTGGTYGIVATTSAAPIAVTVKSGAVSGGLAGVSLLGGSTNTVTNMGTVTALSGLAIQATTGNDTVNNSGTVIGNVDLGTGTNAFNNMAGGLFNSGATVNLGAGNLLTNAGTLSPGGADAIQTTALSGNLTQTATGTLLTDINISGATSDRINVSGKANLAGAVQIEVLNPTLAPFQQTVLSATGGTTNNGLTLLASPALQAQLVFPNATDVVVKSTGINFVTPGLNANQTALGNALNGAAQSGGFGSPTNPIFNVLLNGPTTLAGFGSVLSQLSGEAATGSQQTTFDAMNSFMGTMLDPFNRGPGTSTGPSVSGYAAEGAKGAARDAYAMFTKAPPQTFEARWNVWAAGFGGSQTTDGNAVTGSNSVTSRIAGAAVGADYLISPNTIAGFALAGGGTSFSLANNLGTGRSDLFQAGVYARHTFGAAYISGALAYGWQDITTNRTVTLAGLDQLQAKFNANAFSGRVEGGYRFVSPWIGGIGITPYAAAQFTTFDLPAYAEQALVGTNAFALAYGAKSVTDPRSELGLRTDKSFAMPDGVLTLRGRIAWAHDYDPNRSIGATFQALPGASFVVNGAAQASDSALVTASIEKRWLNGWSAAATFEGEFSDVTSSYAGKGTVRYTW